MGEERFLAEQRVRDEAVDMRSNDVRRCDGMEQADGEERES